MKPPSIKKTAIMRRLATMRISLTRIMRKPGIITRKPQKLTLTSMAE
jgi:hypothetical protein